MAAAVSNAGALGSVALGALDVAAARVALAETMTLTDRPVAANVFVHPTPVSDPDTEAGFLAEIAPAFEAAGAMPPARLGEIYRSFNDDDEILEMLLEVQPAAVSLHFGLADESRMSALKAAGIRVLATATTVTEAKQLAATGVDVLVMQGYGAGGHSGAFLGPPDPGTSGISGLINLIRSTVAAVELPVVAAGGLMDGADVRDVLEAGAAGVQSGTAFISCPESLAGEAYRRALIREGTQLTDVISGRAARGLTNSLMAWATTVSVPVPAYPRTYDAVKQLVAAVADPDFSVMWAGEGAGRAQAIPAAEVVRMLAARL